MVKDIFELEDQYTIGDQVYHNAENVDFTMRLAPATTFPIFTDDSGSATWYNVNASKTQNVGGKLPNGLGFFDTRGIVWDWSFTLSGSSLRVRRGGSWNYDSRYLPVGFAPWGTPWNVYDHNGFRIVRTHF